MTPFSSIGDISDSAFKRSKSISEAVGEGMKGEVDCTTREGETDVKEDDDTAGGMERQDKDGGIAVESDETAVVINVERDEEDVIGAEAEAAGIEECVIGGEAEAAGIEEVLIAAEAEETVVVVDKKRDDKDEIGVQAEAARIEEDVIGEEAEIAGIDTGEDKEDVTVTGTGAEADKAVEIGEKDSDMEEVVEDAEEVVLARGRSGRCG